MTKKGIISGTVPKKGRKRLLLVCLLLVLAIGVGGGLWWYLKGRPKELTPLQQDVKTTITQQEKYTQEDKNAPVKSRVLSLGNLAQSYAYIGECEKAKSALAEARNIATPDLKEVIDRVESDVKGRCP